MADLSDNWSRQILGLPVNYQHIDQNQSIVKLPHVAIVKAPLSFALVINDILTQNNRNKKDFIDFSSLFF